MQAEYWDVDKRAMIRLLDKGASGGRNPVGDRSQEVFVNIYESSISRRLVDCTI